MGERATADRVTPRRAAHGAEIATRRDTRGTQGLLAHASATLEGHRALPGGDAGRRVGDHLADDAALLLLDPDLRLHQPVGLGPGLPGQPVRHPAHHLLRLAREGPAPGREGGRRPGRVDRPGRAPERGDRHGRPRHRHPADHGHRRRPGRGAGHRPGLRREAQEPGRQPRDAGREEAAPGQGVHRRQRPGVADAGQPPAGAQPRPGLRARPAARRRHGGAARAARHLASRPPRTWPR